MNGYQGKADFIALCFSKKDRDTAERIAELLQKAGLRVWGNDRGCRVSRKADRERLAECRTALLLISKEWLADKSCSAQLAAACETERQTVMVFLDDADLTGNAALTPYLGRAVRMIDYRPQDERACFEELFALECITDCRKQPGEQDPEPESGGLFGLFRR